MINLIVENASSIEAIPSPEQFELWIHLATESQQAVGEINLRIVDPQESQQLNCTYRGKDKPTNVLSFPFEPFPGITVESPMLGDLAICASVVQAEATSQHKDITAHWAHLCIHGVLHLLGFDHQVDTDAHAMESLEIKLLAQLGYPNPYE